MAALILSASDGRVAVGGPSFVEDDADIGENRGQEQNSDIEIEDWRGEDVRLK